MGGGFGSKFGATFRGVAAAKLAKETGRPVRLFLDRAQEHLIGGDRPSATGRIKMGATKDGKIVALVAETSGTGGRASSNFLFPYVYGVENSARAHTDVFVNCGGPRAMRRDIPSVRIIRKPSMDDLGRQASGPGVPLKNLRETDTVAGGDTAMRSSVAPS